MIGQEILIALVQIAKLNSHIIGQKICIDTGSNARCLYDKEKDLIDGLASMEANAVD